MSHSSGCSGQSLHSAEGYFSAYTHATLINLQWQPTKQSSCSDFRLPEIFFIALDLVGSLDHFSYLHTLLYVVFCFFSFPSAGFGYFGTENYFCSVELEQGSPGADGTWCRCLPYS